MTVKCSECGVEISADRDEFGEFADMCDDCHLELVKENWPELFGQPAEQPGP